MGSVIAFREDVFGHFIALGFERSLAFRISEDVRKGKVRNGRLDMWKLVRDSLDKRDTSSWYLDSCEKISYLFPRTQAVGYMMLAWRMAWFKINSPALFERVTKADDKLNEFRDTVF